MKKYLNNIIKTAGLVLAFTLSLSSCEQWIDTDLNVDPDSPADVPMNLLLPAVEMNYGYLLAGNDLVRTTSIWMQQFDGVDRQSYTEARYQLMPSDVNNLWNSVYTELFMNTKILLTKAQELGSPWNEGVAKVLIASSLGKMTDVFGDMPFSQGFRGNENILTPAFDTQQEIYDTILVILDEAIADLSAASDPIGLGGDVVYGGSAAKWKKAASALKARHLMQLSLVNGNAAATEALTAATGGFTSNADNLKVPWEEANHNPIFQFMEQRGDVRMGATLVNMMLDSNDPRLPFYAEEDGNGEFTGSVAGSSSSAASHPGSYVAGALAPSMMMTYAEQKFIEAEANFMLGQITPAQTAYETAVAASVLAVTGDANTAWLAAHINGVAVTLELIMTQKYIATYGSSQPYADYRRTGFPAMPLPIGAVIPAMPVRYPYAQEEITYNGANVPTVTLSSILWWDR
ncbi:MAG: SusD/RagB family nutrient-binding outer membrane lipoprotein [Bacteroidales bacterium]